LIARIEAYMQKATNEAKVHTSWTMANAGYDRAVTDFIERSLANPAFVTDFLSLQRPVAYFARFNSLSQTLLKLTSPGVPDIYQGTELWDYSLVDPDNRRPVDYDRRHWLVRDLLAWPEDRRAELTADLVSNAVDGRIKLYLIARVLNFRRDHRDLFENAGYLPLYAEGEKARHVCAFQRVWQDQSLMVITPALNATLAGFEMQPPMGAVWGDTRLILSDHTPGALYVNVLTGESIPVSDQGQIALAEALERFPVALLERQISASRTAH
jgi:(1->4)-alpha-D-glucan 1-alpha-D-glucosylmutase